jgi:hypothetical protein
MRYRVSNKSPGANRPWLIESDEVSQPLAEDPARAGNGVRPVTRASAPAGERRVADSAVSMLVAGYPQVGQNRASSGIAAWQLTQGTDGFYAVRQGAGH